MAPRIKRLATKNTEKSRARSPPPKKAKEATRASSSTPVPPPTSTPCASKAIATGRCISFRFFEEEGFELGENLIALGLQKLCTLELPTYPNLVREFYGTAVRVPDGLLGKVRGINVTITKSLLHSLLNVSITGLEPYHMDRRDLALNAALDRENCDPFMTITSHDLNAESRLVLSIIGRIIFPKTGRFEFISERDLAIMYHILNTIDFDMASMMITHMSASIGKSRFSLPYGMVLTLVFRHYNIVIPSTESTIKLRHTDYYSDSTLHRMGFIKTEGKWIKKTGSVPTTEIPASTGKSTKHSEPYSPTSSPSHHSDVPTGLGSPSVPPPAAASILSTDQLDMLSSHILHALTPRLDDLHKQNEELKQQVQELKDQNATLQAQISHLTEEVSKRV